MDRNGRFYCIASAHLFNSVTSAGASSTSDRNAIATVSAVTRPKAATLAMVAAVKTRNPATRTSEVKNMARPEVRDHCDESGLEVADEQDHEGNDDEQRNRV